jgi:cytochrome c oxidase subunit 3
MDTETIVKHEEDHSSPQAEWSGGKPALKASYGKLMMWYFLVSDAFTFAGFLIAYGALRVSMPSWPVPDFVFSTFPFLEGVKLPLLFVTFMTFLLLFSSFTMVRAVQEGHRENKNGVAIWMVFTIIGGLGFLGSQAWEWKTLIGKEHMSLTVNPFGTHTESGVYLNSDGSDSDDVFQAGTTYLMHTIGGHHGEESHEDSHGEEAHGSSHTATGDYADAMVDEKGFIHRKYKVTEGPDAGKIKHEIFGPRAFGALFFFITGFHGFHVLSGVVFLILILVNVLSGLYVKRKNGYEMVEKIGLYWHFVDLVWVFVFLVFYLL